MKKPRALKQPVSELPDGLPADVLPAALFQEPVIAARMIHCTICGSDTREHSPENMCWVCRRLKISAWRDVEQQAPVQE